MLLFFGNWWSELNGTTQLFWGIAIVFSLLFLIQFALCNIGFDKEADKEQKLQNQSLESRFSIFSARSIIGFFMVFGWVGLGVFGLAIGLLQSLIIASISGFIMMFCIAYFSFKNNSAYKNELLDAVDNIGDVHLTIPGNKAGKGKIQVQIKGVNQELEAMTLGESIKIGMTIRVIDILEENVTLVEAY